uniref:CLIC N-terminal domain-containing protein n=1 Tax=Bos mutus grunniens TaxID=30521 RepID=A0A8C0A405_BOSMU
MILWLKGIIFNVTTGDLKRKPTDLQNLAPGTNPPFMTLDGKVKTDVSKIEEFLEEKLAPPRWVPKLGTQHPESNSARNDVFAKFSAFIKNTKKDANERVPPIFLFSPWTSIPPLVWLLIRCGEFCLTAQWGGTCV